MFDVRPEQIEALDSKELVLLLGRLLQAEARAYDLDVAGVAVPLQITVADGGEDGRIEWSGGKLGTDYLPWRSTYFQCKASSIGRAGWKRECWTKATQRKGKARKLTPALTSIIAKGACYVGFTTEALTNDKVDDCVAAIKEGIAEAGGDATKLSAIRLYDANKIAQWTTHHPAVSVWLSEKAYVRSLAGYRTIESWGKRKDFKTVVHIDDAEQRFEIGLGQARDRTGADNTLAAAAMGSRLLSHIATDGRTIRVLGPSGVGKSRFVFETMEANSTLAQYSKSLSIFADYVVVADSLLGVATQLATSARPTLLVVDQCPRDVAVALLQITTAADSTLRVVTIDTNDRPLEDESVMHITVKPSSGPVIEGIIRARNPKIDPDKLERLIKFSKGLPKLAVLMASNVYFKTADFDTIDDMVEEILKGANIRSEDELRALQSLSLIEDLGFDSENEPSHLDLVAHHLARMTGDEMYEHLAKAEQHDLVDRTRRGFTAQPLPVAVNLAAQRLKIIRPQTLWRFMATQPHELVLSMLRRWRHLELLPIMAEAIDRLFQGDGPLSGDRATLTAEGTAILDALVHIVPDKIAAYLRSHALDDTEVLATTGDTRRNLVDALSKLVFREQSFGIAARLLMRLGAHETEEWVNNAKGIFKQLFQLHLSGTEVAPDERFVILDEGLESDDLDVRALCVETLSAVFQHDFMRFGDTADIGSGPPLKDWEPTTWDEIDQFHQAGMERLLALRSLQPELAGQSEDILVNATRMMLNTSSYELFGEALASIAQDKGWWPEATESVGDWLYFDRPETDDPRSVYVRELYSRLFPKDPIERAILYTKFWRSEIRDPDTRYTATDNDFGYSERKAREVADEIAASPGPTAEACRRLPVLDLKGVQPFAEQLAIRTADRAGMFDVALAATKSVRGQVYSGMLRGLLAGIDRIDGALADTCLQKAAAQLQGQVPLVDLYSAVSLNSQRLDTVIAELQSGKISPSHCVFLSYGQGLNKLADLDVARFLQALASKGPDGAWTALEVGMMYKYGEPISAQYATDLSALLVHPDLLGAVRTRGRDAHIFETVLGKVRNTIGLNPAFAWELSKLMVLLISSNDGELLRSLDRAMRVVVAMLAKDQPQIVWDALASFFETATPIERNRLRQIAGPSRDRFDGKPRIEAGPLFEVPINLILDWVAVDPKRSEFLPSFFPTLMEHDGKLAWHPEIERAAAEHGKVKDFRDALAQRIVPRSWSNSLIPLLEPYLEPLQSWFQHSNPALKRWAKEEHSMLERRIQSERDFEERRFN